MARRPSVTERAIVKLGWTHSNLLGDDAEGSASKEIQAGLVVALAQDADEDSTITATFGNSAAVVLKAKDLVWTRNADGEWSCTTDVDEKFRASGCKNDLGDEEEDD